MFLQTPRATRYTNSVEKGLKKLTLSPSCQGDHNSKTIGVLFTKWVPD